MTNNVNFVLTATEQTAISNALQTIQQTLNGKLFSLSDADRRGGVKMGDKSIAFVQKAASYGNQFSAELPASINLTALQVDVDAVTLINGYLQQLGLITRGLEDTMLVSGTEAMEGANLVYGAMKFAIASGVAGAQEAVNDMGQRYAIKSKAIAPKANDTKA